MMSMLLSQERSKLISFFKAIRLHQSIKNLLVFVPLLASHRYSEFSYVFNAFVAFISFCLLASSVYLINDLSDIDADKTHHSKHKRPFAAGEFSINFGLSAAILFVMTAFLCAFELNRDFLFVLMSYFILSSAYSFFLKQKLVIDVFVLAMLYTLRIIAGIAAIHAEYSEWLITFSIFFFLSFAFVKRYSELYFMSKNNKTTIKRRDYHIGDLPQISLFGTVSGYVSILVFAFYINSPKIKVFYHHPQWLWSVCLLLLYWITRVWMLTTRGIVNEDPILFVLKDRLSVTIFMVITLIMYLAHL